MRVRSKHFTQYLYDVSLCFPMTREEAKEFASRWLPAWTGNRPNELIAYYSEDAFYSDPGIPNGVKGNEALLGYFQKLLAQNPNWVWTQIEVLGERCPILSLFGMRERKPQSSDY